MILQHVVVGKFVEHGEGDELSAVNAHGVLLSQFLLDQLLISVGVLFGPLGCR